MIDVMEEFSDITTNEMTTIIYGEDLSNETIDIDCLKDSKFTRKTLTFGCALTEIIM